MLMEKDRKSKVTKNRIIDAAIEEFYSNGFSKASLRTIANEAEATTGAIYFFFRDKNDLFKQVIEIATIPILSKLSGYYEKDKSEYLINENEGFSLASEILDLYYDNQIVCEIILRNREHQFVLAFFDELIAMLDNQNTILLSEQTNQKFFLNELTFHWFSHLILETILYLVEHKLPKEEVKAQLKTMIHFLYSGLMSLK